MKKIIKSTLLIALVILTESCAIFKGRVEIDMQTFSDNTNILFNEAVKVSRPFQFKTLSIYTNIEEYEKIKSRSRPLINALKGIVYYSNQLVAISNSSMSEGGKNEQLAIYLEDVFDKVEHKERMDSIGLTQSQIDITLNKIKKAPSYREGIEAADPIVKTIVLSMFDRLDEVEALIDEVIRSFDEQIYNDFKTAIVNYLALKELQNTTQGKLTQLYYAQTGEITLIDSLINSDISITPFFSNKDSISQNNYDNAEEFLFKRLNNIDLMLRQLEDDKKEYMDMKEEISRWHGQVDEKISIARNSMIVWSQSHKNLGIGIEIPPLIGVETFIDLIQPAVGGAADLVF
jgi:hypothetical protein